MRGTAGSIVMASPFTPASPEAAAISDLFTRALFVCGAVFILVAVLVGVCVIRFRAGRAGVPSQVEGHTPLEIAWTVAPILVLVWLLFFTVRAMNVSDPPVNRAPDLTVIAHQWWWEARYPSGAVTANEIHVPVGKALVIRIESSDVVHDFWVPELGRKIDAVPGRPATIWLEADHAGTYLGTCAEYCGAQHAWMRILVVAEPPEAFGAWERAQLAPAPRPTDPAALRGAATFNAMTCVNCHALGRSEDRAHFGPDLTHVATRTTLGAGALANTPASLALWLHDPQAIKAGCHMPDAQLSDDQVSDLVAYFEVLR